MAAKGLKWEAQKGFVSGILSSSVGIFSVVGVEAREPVIEKGHCKVIEEGGPHNLIGDSFTIIESSNTMLLIVWGI